MTDALTLLRKLERMREFVALPTSLDRLEAWAAAVSL